MTDPVDPLEALDWTPELDAPAVRQFIRNAVAEHVPASTQALLAASPGLSVLPPDSFGFCPIMHGAVGWIGLDIHVDSFVTAGDGLAIFRVVENGLPVALVMTGER